MAVTRRRLLFLSILFFLSGFSALAYQIAWQRLIGLFSGSDSISITLVVGAFLAGLGIGSLAASGFADRLSARTAIFLFAACETGVAAFALASKYLFYDVLFNATGVLGGSRILIFLVAVVCLLVPTFLMGLSLPLLSKGVVQRIDGAAERIGWLYAVNTLGAALGAFAAGCYIVGTFGYAVTIYFAAFLNLLVGAGALLLGVGIDAVRPAKTAAATAIKRSASGNPEVWWWCLMVFVSGFIIISLEIIWLRVIGVALKSSAYTFPLVLACFLFGDGLGLLVGTLAVRHVKRHRRFFLWLQGCVALYAVAALWLLAVVYGTPTLHDALWPSVSVFFDAYYDSTVPPLTFGDVALVLGIVAVPVIPPAVLLGMSIPITQKAIQDDLASVGHRVGLIQVANIAGNAAGSFVTGLVFLQYLGTPGSLRLIVLLGLASVVWIMMNSAEPRARRSSMAEALVAGGLLILLVGFPDAVGFWGRLHTFDSGEKIFVGEDRTGIALLEYDSPEQSRLFLGGKQQSKVPFGPGHMLLGVLGGLVHPAPKSALIVGLGTGGTAYGAGFNPAMERVRVVEILAPIYNVMRKFSALSGRTAVDLLLEDPRYRLEEGDARHVLFTDAAKYDVIEADAIFPHDSHSGLLYSVEYFRQVREHLNPGGICVQWAPTQRTVNSFVAAFPYVVKIGNYLLGSDRLVPFDAEAIIRRLHEPVMLSRLAAAGWSVDPLEKLLRENGQNRKDWRPGSPASGDLNTDLLPKDEFYLNSN